MTATARPSGQPRAAGSSDAAAGAGSPGAPAGQVVTDRPNRVLAVLLAAGTVYALSQTLVLPALTTLARDYEVGPATASWVLTGFLLSASIATPIVGKLGDRYGKGRMLTAVLVVFAVGGVVNALAPTIGVLIAGRVLQGVAGGLFPLAFGVVRDAFPRARVPGAISLISAVFGVGSGIGLPLSGVIVDHLDVSWLFWISLVTVPVALVARRVVPPSPPSAGEPVDWLGAALLAGGLACLLLGVTQAPSWGWGSPGNVGLLAVGAVLVAVWLRVESRVASPLVRLDVLRTPTVAATNLTGFMVGLAMFSGFLLIPQLAQTPASTGYGLGATATVAGLLLLPSAVGQLAVGPVAGRTGVALGFRLTLVVGAALVAVAFVLLALAHTAAWHLMLGGLLLGAGIAFAFASMANLVVDSVRQDEVGVATGINTVLRTVGGSFGSAIASSILAASITAQGLPARSGYTAAFVFSAAMGVLAVVAALLVPRRGARVAGAADPPSGTTDAPVAAPADG